MKYLFLISSIFCLLSCSNNRGKEVSEELLNIEKSQIEEKPDGNLDLKNAKMESTYPKYILNPSIKESCINPVFTDSLWRAWNDASIFYIEKENKMKKDSLCWWITLYLFEKGENYRLEFAKTLNRDGILKEENLDRPFFIVEIEESGESVSNYNYILIDDYKSIKGIEYKIDIFNKSDKYWYKNREFCIEKKKFNSFFDNLKRKSCKGKSLYFFPFYITKFTPSSIESYLMQCGDDFKCIDEFYRLADVIRYKGLDY